jgi:hypothetical protein
MRVSTGWHRGEMSTKLLPGSLSILIGLIATRLGLLAYLGY